MKFGLKLPLGIFGELAGQDPDRQRAALIRSAQLAEDCGFDAIYACDHLATIPDERDDPVFECWTALAALSQHTERVRLGQLVSPVGLRNPALLAKMAATLDVLSGGRVELGVGAGWMRREYESYGFPFAGDGARVRMLAESLHVVRTLWTNRISSYHGEFFDLDAARCTPKPVRGRIPVLVGGEGPKMLRLIAEHADRANFFSADATEFRAKARQLRDACRGATEIELTWSCSGVVIGATPGERDDMANRVRATGSPLSRFLHVVATTDEALRLLESFAAAGASEVMLQFSDYPDERAIELFAAHVMPKLR